MTIKLSLPKAYQEIHPLCGSEGNPIRCTPAEDHQITSLDQFSEAFKLLVNQTSPTLLIQDIREEAGEVLSWFT